MMFDCLPRTWWRLFSGKLYVTQYEVIYAHVDILCEAYIKYCCNSVGTALKIAQYRKNCIFNVKFNTLILTFELSCSKFVISFCIVEHFSSSSVIDCNWDLSLILWYSVRNNQIAVLCTWTETFYCSVMLVYLHYLQYNNSYNIAVFHTIQ